MKILFVNLSTLIFNVATPSHEPLGGSESCVCYLARTLASKGHDVSLIARLPENSPTLVMGVKHYRTDVLKGVEFFTAQKFDAIIVCNAAIACPFLREASPQSRILLWDHVPPDQPSMRELGNPEILKAIDGIVYVSEWQKKVTEIKFGITKTSRVIGNGLTPSFENLFTSTAELLKAKQNRAAYTTIPYRGLPILLAAMKGLRHDTKLDIYSSMRVYQLEDSEYADLYKQAVKDPRISTHGSVSQTELAERLKPAAFLTYPCICEETYCISALEAMAAGMKVIATRLGALETTTMGYADLMPVETHQGEELAVSFRQLMDKNISTFLLEPEAWAERMFEQIHAVNQFCSWNIRAEEWEKFAAPQRS